MADRCPPPPAPGRLPAIAPGDLLRLRRPTVLRIYPRGGPHPSAWSSFRRYGPLTGMRFDHHPPPPRTHPSHAVMYAAIAAPGAADGLGDPLPTAVLEVFGDAGVIDRAQLDHWLVLWRAARTLRVLDLAGSDWIARAGATSALMSGPRAVARQWAAAIWAAYPDLDGVAWMSSHLPTGRALVLFERAGSALPSAPVLHTPLANPGLLPALARIAEQYGMTLR